MFVRKHQTDVSSIEDKVIFLYSQGISTLDIQKTMQEMYGIDVDIAVFQRLRIKSCRLSKNGRNGRFRTFTNTPTGKFMLTVFGAVAELERECILQRQQEEIAIAKQQGKYKGKKSIQPENFDRVVRRWKNGEISAVKARELLGMSKSTFYRKILF